MFFFLVITYVTSLQEPFFLKSDKIKKKKNSGEHVLNKSTFRVTLEILDPNLSQRLKLF